MAVSVPRVHLGFDMFYSHCHLTLLSIPENQSTVNHNNVVFVTVLVITSHKRIHSPIITFSEATIK